MKQSFQVLLQGNSQGPHFAIHREMGTRNAGAKDMEIKKFQELIRDKYEKRDRQRGIPATFMWFIEEVGELATALSGQQGEDSAGGRLTAKAEEFADVFAWLCTLANISDVDLEKACQKYTSGDISGFK